MPELAPDAWKATDPTQMSYDQLAAARTAVGRVYEDIQARLNWLNSARLRLDSEIAARFGLQVPGLPPAESLAEYPIQWMQNFEWDAALEALQPATTDEEVRP